MRLEKILSVFCNIEDAKLNVIPDKSNDSTFEIVSEKFKINIRLVFNNILQIICDSQLWEYSSFLNLKSLKVTENANFLSIFIQGPSQNFVFNFTKEIGNNTICK